MKRVVILGGRWWGPLDASLLAERAARAALDRWALVSALAAMPACVLLLALAVSTSGAGIRPPWPPSAASWP